MNHQKLFTLTIGIVLNSLWLTSANALTISFSRQYEEGSLEGMFRATDDDNDQFISAQEVRLFEATVMDSSGQMDKIASNEGQLISLFEYEIGENELAFFVQTTDRVDPFPFGSNIGFDVDFARELDFFLDSDVFSPLFDPDNTEIAQVIPQVPEPTSTLAFFILGGLGVVSRLR